MEPKGIPTTTFRHHHHHHRSTSSDRFLGLFSSSPSSTVDSGDDNELNEDEILWTGDFTEPKKHSNTPTNPTTTTNHHRSSIPLNSGILAALPEFNHHSIIYRKSSISSSSTSSKLIIPSSIPRPDHYSLKTQSMPTRKFQQSAPMNFPTLSMAMEKQRNYNKFSEIDDDDEKGYDDDMMLPPHEIVARGSGVSPKTTFSVLEGVGRTLKGRDLRQVRNAVWRKTGFLDS